jgi:NADPH-dependent 2,4-dienoyl-CoA reductase/sulfur reductase-like enzyme
MIHHKYLIIGGGMTAAAAVQGIRELDQSGSIAIVSSEPDPPYDRPPLTKALWKGKPVESIWRDTESQNVEIVLGRTARILDPDRRTVTDEQGEKYEYDKLLLATGGTPRKLSFGGQSILYYRTFRDYQRLRALTVQGRRFAVIGGGFIGSEIAAALAMNQKEVVLLLRGKGICDRAFPADLSQFVTDYYRQKGVKILTDSAVDVIRRGNQLTVKTESGLEIAVDGVVAGLGITPNVELAQQAGLKVENGIVVDEMLRTGQKDIFAAGDVAAFQNPALQKRIRVEHEDNANSMGRIAGRNMAGASDPYHHLPMFYSDLFDLGYEAVGELDASLPIMADWKEPYREGVVYYHQDGRVRGVLLWNVWGQVDAARELIASRNELQIEKLKGMLPKAA